VSRKEALLPTLPLWAAALIALATEAALVTGLAQLSTPSVVAPPQIPLEISLVAAPALTESAAVEAVSSISSAPSSEPPPPPEPEPIPEPPPIQTVAPPPVPVPVALAPAKPKPKLKFKPKLKPLPVVQKPLPVAPKMPAAKRPQRIPSAPLRPAKTDSAASNNAVKTTESKAGASSAASYLSNPAPAYPDGARRLRQEGTVQLRVLVSPSGSASTVSIASSSGVASLDQAALRAVQRWRFKPAQRDGVAVVATVQVPIRFKLN
jgi:periplasmic protein TonB